MRAQMSNVVEFKPGCLMTEAKPLYKQIKNKHRLHIGNVVFIGETKSQNEWRAYWQGMAERPQTSWFGGDMGGAA